MNLKHLFFFALSIAFQASALNNPWEAPDLNAVTFHKTPTHDPVVLIDHGKALGTICIMGDVDETALTELQKSIKLTTGVDLPVVHDQIKLPALVIGGAMQGVKFEPEELAIRTSSQQVQLAGDGPGTSWAIYEFLERYVGVRWYAPGDLGRSTPHLDSLVVPPVFLTDAPVFRKRELWPSVSHPQDGTGTDLRPLHHALRSFDSWPMKLKVHTPVWSKVEDYKKNRPEIFELTKDGKRNYEMLCYSNPKTLDTFLENIQRHFDGDKSAIIGIRGDTISVSPNDDDVECYCPDCRKTWDPNGGKYGTASRTVSLFVVKLATEVQKRWPDKKILFLPYVNYAKAPEGIKFPSNVYVQLCGMPGMGMYKEPSLYNWDVANLDKWYELTGKKKVQNWLYVCWPEGNTKSVFQYPHIVQKYYRENREKIVGSFINGGTDHWPRQGITLYCWLKLLWNPEFNVDVAIDEYCKRMFGPAAWSMHELIDIQIDRWENSRYPDAYLNWRHAHDFSWPDPVRAQMFALLEKAKAQAAGDQLASDRIAYYATPFDAFFKSFNQK